MKWKGMLYRGNAAHPLESSSKSKTRSDRNASFLANAAKPKPTAKMGARTAAGSDADGSSRVSRFFLGVRNSFSLKRRSSGSRSSNALSPVVPFPPVPVQLIRLPFSTSANTTSLEEQEPIQEKEELHRQGCIWERMNQQARGVQTSRVSESRPRRMDSGNSGGGRFRKKKGVREARVSLPFSCPSPFVCQCRVRQN